MNQCSSVGVCWGPMCTAAGLSPTPCCGTVANAEAGLRLLSYTLYFNPGSCNSSLRGVRAGTSSGTTTSEVLQAALKDFAIGLGHQQGALRGQGWLRHLGHVCTADSDFESS